MDDSQTETNDESTDFPSPITITVPSPLEDDVSCCSEATYDDDDRVSNGSSAASVPPSIEIPTRSVGSRSSMDGFPTNSTPSSLTVDRGTVAQACATLGQIASEVQQLDLSTSTRKPRRPLKNLRALSELTSLVQLDATGNAIEKLDGLQLFPQMQTLTLARNNLKILGAPLFTLQGLTHLDISGNFIVHLPKGFSGLTQLEVLNLSGNNLGTLKEVDVLAPLANLLRCNLAANPFCRLPTYKDYVVCKLRSLEYLDDVQISTTARDRAAKRFGAAMFSQDACLREADRAHEHEQNRLLQAQSALEAENLRLKGELQVKSKLLQNKSRAWSTATEQLLQLQQEVAMLNLDRRRSISMSPDKLCNAEQIAMTIASRTSNSATVQRPRSAPRIQSPERSVEKRRGSFSHRDTHNILSGDNASEAGSPYELAHQATSPMTPPHAKSPKDALFKRNKGKMLVDASCSPLRVIPTPLITSVSSEEPAQENEVTSKSCEKDTTVSKVPVPDEMKTAEILSPVAPQPRAPLISPKKQHDRAQNIEQIRRALADLDQKVDVTAEMMSPTATPMKFAIKEDSTYGLNAGRAERFPTFEDDAACPAYEDVNVSALQLRSSSASNLSAGNSHALTSGSHSLPPSPASSPSRLREWFRRQKELQKLTPPPSPPKPAPSPSKPRQPKLEVSPLAPFVDKEVLARQIQSLQSCKQSLLTEIRNEEHILHVLKQESAQYEDQIDRLSVNIQACIDGDPSAIQFSFSSSGSPRTISSKKRREEETNRGRLEILRNKLRFAEDKEKEIETTMVCMTKRVLQADLNTSGGITKKFSPMELSTRSDVPFDKEIFALTHKLQLVIVEKEEIHMQMIHLMAQLRGDSGNNGDPFGFGPDGGEENGGGAKVSSKQGLSLAKSRQMVDELRTRHREVSDRIQLKERRIASLLDELKEVEAELDHISRLNESSALSPLFQRERASTMDFLQSQRKKETGATDGDVFTGIVNHPSFNEGAQLPGISLKLASEHVSQLMEAAATSDSGLAPINLQFKELLGTDKFEKLKADIYEKISQQLATSVGSSGEATSVDGYRKGLHEAIAAALETRLKLAPNGAKVGSGQAQNSEQNNNAQTATDAAASTESPTSDEAAWKQFDEFASVETYYARKFVMMKDRVAAFVNSCSEEDAVANPKLAARSTGAQRILKMCERLSAAETQYKVDPLSKVELDQLGKNRSSLKITLMSARDLPTTHLRTKNLDPYVSLEVVYPPHALSPQQNNSSTIGRVHRSQTKKKSIYPVWDEEFEFSPILSLNGYLHVRVLNDRRLGREQVVGETRIPLHTLLHQRRIVEWFSLGLTVPSESTGSIPRGRVVSKVCGGAVRLQLHLTFSCVERYKRVIDELVSRYFHDHGQLPPFIDAVEECHKKSEQSLLNDHPEQNGTEPPSAQEESNTMTYERRQHADAESHFPLDELQISMTTYKGWNPDRQETQTETMTFGEASKLLSTPSEDRVAVSKLSVDRSKALWEPKTQASKAAPVVIDGRKPPVRASSGTMERKKQQPTPTSSSHRSQSKLRAAVSLQQRRKRGENDTPECFDEYSPYHPAFKSVDPLDGCNNEPARMDARSASGTRGFDVARKTDLRIFKSPSISRRPPSAGFPERYIGLDNQTCERLKRIIGRMDGTPVGSN